MEMWGETGERTEGTSELEEKVEGEQGKNKREGERSEMAIASTGLFFLVFLLPTAFGIFGFPFTTYPLFSIAVHEAGHLFAGILFGWDSILAVAGGTGLEYAVPILSVLAFGRSRRGATLAMIFIACTGSIMPGTAHYMETANYPHQTSVAGALAGVQGDMTPYSHDWNRMFLESGMLGQEFRIAAYVRKVGEALLLAGVVGSVVGFWFMLNYSPARFPELLLVGGIPSALYFALRAAAVQLAVCAGIVLLAVSWYAFVSLEERFWKMAQKRKLEGPKEKK